MGKIIWIWICEYVANNPGVSKQASKSFHWLPIWDHYLIEHAVCWGRNLSQNQYTIFHNIKQLNLLPSRGYNHCKPSTCLQKYVMEICSIHRNVNSKGELCENCCISPVSKIGYKNQAKTEVRYRKSDESNKRHLVRAIKASHTKTYPKVKVIVIQ